MGSLMSLLIRRSTTRPMTLPPEGSPPNANASRISVVFPAPGILRITNATALGDPSTPRFRDFLIRAFRCSALTGISATGLAQNIVELHYLQDELLPAELLLKLADLLDAPDEATPSAPPAKHHEPRATGSPPTAMGS